MSNRRCVGYDGRQFLEVTMLPHETATALDPQAKAVIDLVIESGRPPYHQLSPKDARR